MHLKEWTMKLDVPVLSIDYSLAPEAAFPRAVEEVFYAYCWVLNNPEHFGSTGENIVLVGDSAGGNLVTTCVIKCIEMGIKKPKGLFNIYSVFMANYVMAPSRYLGLMDVILPYSPFMEIFKIYTGYRKKTVIKENRKVPSSMHAEKNHDLPQNYLFSPQLISVEVTREFPRTILLTTNLDPCLDDCVEFSKKLRRERVNVHLDVLEGLHHGFLNLSVVNFYISS